MGTYVHAFTPIPPVDDFQSPPLAEPSQIFAVSVGSSAMHKVLPPIFLGPIFCHEPEVRFGREEFLSVEEEKFCCMKSYALEYASGGKSFSGNEALAERNCNASSTSVSRS